MKGRMGEKERYPRLAIDQMKLLRGSDDRVLFVAYLQYNPPRYIIPITYQWLLRGRIYRPCLFHKQHIAYLNVDEDIIT